MIEVLAADGADQPLHIRILSVESGRESQRLWLVYHGGRRDLRVQYQDEGSAVPSDHRGGLNHLQTCAPARPEARQQNPQQAVGALEMQTAGRVGLQNCQLVTECKNLGLKGGAGAKTGDNEGKQSNQSWFISRV